MANVICPVCGKECRLMSLLANYHCDPCNYGDSKFVKASPPRDLFDAVCEALTHVATMTDDARGLTKRTYCDTGRFDGINHFHLADELSETANDVLARVAAWRKEVGG